MSQLLIGCREIGITSVDGKDAAADAFSCYPVAVDGASLSTFCVNCRIAGFNDRSNSIDTDVDSYATLSLFHPDDLAAQASHFSVDATSATQVFAAGSRAGVVAEVPSATTAAYSIAVATYLAGTLQDVHSPTPLHVGPSSSQLVFLGFDDGHPTTKDFDAVEIHISELVPWVEEHVFKLHEFCADGAAIDSGE